MSIIHVVAPIDPIKVLRALNHRPLEMREVTRFERDFPPTYDPQNLIDYKPSRVSLTKFDEIGYTAYKLRLYVDDWIDTGVTDGTREAPLQRSVMKAELATAALRKIAKESHPRLFVLPKLPEFVISFDHDDASSVEFHNPVELAWKNALELFLKLMMSDWGPFLCKCRAPQCGRYFIKKKYKVKVYKHGVFCCPAHQRNSSALVCNARRRAFVEHELISYAAQQLQKVGAGSGWQRDKQRKLRLAERIREHLRSTRNPDLQSCQSKWVTQHQDEIEERRVKLGEK